MPFGRYTCRVQWHIVLDWDPWPPREGEIWEVKPQPKLALAYLWFTRGQHRSAISLLTKLLSYSSLTCHWIPLWIMIATLCSWADKRVYKLLSHITSRQFFTSFNDFFQSIHRTAHDIHHHYRHQQTKLTSICCNVLTRLITWHWLLIGLIIMLSPQQNVWSSLLRSTWNKTDSD